MNRRWEKLLIDREAQGDPLVMRVHERLPDAKIESTDEALRHLSSPTASENTIVLMRRRGAFVKDFPRTPNAPPCGEKYIVTAMNCPYSCSYCYLHSYLGHRSIVIFTDTERMKEEAAEAIARDAPRIMTTGEMSDSLALDRLTGTTLDLLPLFRESDTLLEARTKSDAVDHLLAAALGPPGAADANDPRHRAGGSETRGGPLDSLLVTWTLGPEEMIANEEPGTAPLAARLAAIGRLAGTGARIGVRFDPIIPAYAGIDLYRRVMDGLKAAIATNDLYRFELGILRFPPGLIERVRERTPRSPILRGEFLRDGEGKLRLYRPARISLYRDMAALIRERFPRSPIELSMESRDVWEDAGIEPPSHP
jgi:spore photoproduct lyase